MEATVKQTFMAIAAGAVLAGCKSQEMSSTPFYTGNDVKYTDKVEDRVSLWPLLYHRAPVTSVLWPVFSSADDHVAVRPLYSQYMKHGRKRYNEYNVLWPITQFDTYDNHYRIFPFFWGDNYFIVFPAFWNSDHVVSVPPVIVDKDGDGMMILPCFFWDWKDDFNTLFPVWWFDLDSDGDHLFWAAAGLGGYRRNKSGMQSHWLLPLYVSNGDDLFTLPYSRMANGNARESYFMAGFAGCKYENDKYDSSWLFPLYAHEAKDGKLVTPFCYRDDKMLVTPIYGHTKKSNWLLPLYWQDEHTFLSLPWIHHLGSDGLLETAISISPLLLSGYSRHGNYSSCAYLLAGLAGYVKQSDRAKPGSWVFPFYYSDTDSNFFSLLYGRRPGAYEWLIPFYYRNVNGTFITPIAGRTKDAGWVLPLYVRDENSFTSIAYASSHNPETGETSLVIPPLLAGRSWNTNSQESAWGAFAGIVGGATDKDGSHANDWLIPLWYHEKDRAFASFLFGWDATASQTNRWWLTPLVGTKSGAEEGFWIEPFCSYTHSGDFARIMSIANCETLPADITFHEVAYTNYKEQVSMRLKADKPIPNAKMKTKVALFFTPNSRHAHAGLSCDGKEYTVRDTVEHGNELAFHRERTHTVEFDPKTRTKKEDRVHETSMFALGSLYNSSRTETREKVDEKSNTLFGLLYNRHREVDKRQNTSFEEDAVLLKVWQRTVKNGDVSVDAFPGFTYDAKKDGYRKVSLLWRLFHHINDPKKGTSLDLFFIPVMRP